MNTRQSLIRANVLAAREAARVARRLEQMGATASAAVARDLQRVNMASARRHRAKGE